MHYLKRIVTVTVLLFIFAFIPNLLAQAISHIGFEAESGSSLSGASIASDSNASGGSYLAFGNTNPSAQDRPNSTNTGHNGNLTRTFNGPLTINQAWLDANNGGSKVLENVRFKGVPFVDESTTQSRTVTVAVNDLTIRNFEVTGGRYGIYNGHFEGNPTTGLVLEDGELSGSAVASLVLDNTVARRLHIHHNGGDAMKIYNNFTLEDSYIHHIGSILGVHADGLQMVSGRNNVFRGNNFDMPHDEPGYSNSMIFIIQTEVNVIDNILIDGNWLNGGGYAVMSRDKGKGFGPPTNVRITNNRFGRDYQFGLFSTDGTVVVTGNVWDDTGEPANKNP